jgi:hypothetical protein
VGEEGDGVGVVGVDSRWCPWIGSMAWEFICFRLFVMWFSLLYALVMMGEKSNNLRLSVDLGLTRGNISGRRGRHAWNELGDFLKMLL